MQTEIQSNINALYSNVIDPRTDLADGNTLPGNSVLLVISVCAIFSGFLTFTSALDSFSPLFLSKSLN